MRNVLFSSLLILACAAPTHAAEPNELELVRPDAKSFVSVRVAEVAKKFDLETWLEKAGSDKIPQLKNVRDWWAGPLNELTRITQVHLGDSYCGCVHIFQTTKGCDRDKILAHLVPEGKWIEFEGAKYLISAKGEPSGHFAVFYLDDERTIMSHSPDAIQKFLVKPQVERPAKPGFHDAMKAAQTKDIAAWRDAVGQKLLEDPDQKFGGLEAVAGSLEFGAKLQVEATGYFALPEQTKIGATFARMYLKQARTMMLSMSFSGESNELRTRKEPKADLWPGAIGLLDALESDLRSARLETKGNAVSLSMALSVDPKAIKTHAEEIAATDGSMFAGIGMINRYATDEEIAKMAEINKAMDAKSPPPSSAVPSPEDMKRRAAEMGIAPPEYFPADPAGVTQGTPPPAMPLPVAPPSVLPAMPQPVAPQPQAVLLPTGATSPAPALPMASPSLLTIVNTRSEAAMVFAIGSDATLEFKRKLAPGKLFDAPTFQGARWVVVFSEKPGSQNYTVGTEKIWLLREPENLEVGLFPPKPAPGQPLKVAEVRNWEAHQAYVTMAAFSPAADKVASGSEDGTAILWDATNGKKLHELKDNVGGVLMTTFSPDGKTLAVSDRGANIVLYETATGAKRAAIDDETTAVSALTYTPDGKNLFTFADDGIIKARDADGKLSFKLEGHKRQGIALAVSPDGKRLASGGGSWGEERTGGELKVWDWNNKKELWSAKGEFGGVWGTAFSPDGKLVAAACLDGTVRLWEAETGKESFTMQGHESRVIWVAFSKDGWLASASLDGTVRFWEPSTGKEAAVLKHEQAVQRLSFTPDGKSLATAGNDGKVRIWSIVK